MFLQESLEVDTDADHATGQGIDACLDRFLVAAGRASRHLLRRLLDLL